MEDLSAAERRSQIAQLVLEKGRVLVADLVGQFQVTETSIRRDLTLLEAGHRVKRVHGGAIATTQAPPEQPILQRQNEQTEEKARIGRAAAALVQDGETIFLGSGTTVLETARALRGQGEGTDADLEGDGSAGLHCERHPVGLPH